MASTFAVAPSIDFKSNNSFEKAPQRANYKEVCGIITLDATPNSCVIETGLSQVDGFTFGAIGSGHTTALYGTVSDSSTVPGTKIITVLGTASKTGYIRFWGIPKL